MCQSTTSAGLQLWFVEPMAVMAVANKLAAETYISPDDKRSGLVR